MDFGFLLAEFYQSRSNEGFFASDLLCGFDSFEKPFVIAIVSVIDNGCVVN